MVNFKKINHKTLGKLFQLLLIITAFWTCGRSDDLIPQKFSPQPATIENDVEVAFAIHDKTASLSEQDLHLENLHGRLNDAPIYEEDCVGDFHLESEDPLEIAVTLDCDLEDFGVELVISFMVIEDEDDMMIEIHDLHMDIIGEFNMDELTNCETGLAVESEDPLDLDIEMDCVSGEGESNGHSHE